MTTNKVAIAQLTERSISIHEDILEIKKILSDINGSARRHGKEIVRIDGDLVNHLKLHKETKDWVKFVPSVISVVVASYALFISLSG